MKLQPELGEIIKAKYSGQNFGSMSPGNLLTTSGAVIALVATITGWSLPTAEGLTLLKSLLASTLQKEYSTLTVEEIKIAFTRHGSKIKDYAKDVNISLFNQVMDHYFTERNEAVRVESDVAAKEVEEKVKSEQDIKNQSRATVEECFRDFKAGKFDPIKSNISASLFDTLTGDSWADPALSTDYISKGFAAYRSSLIAEKQRLRALDAGKSERRSEEIGYKVKMNEVDMELALLERTLQYTKRYALKYAFEFMKKNGKGFYQKEAE